VLDDVPSFIFEIEAVHNLACDRTAKIRQAVLPHGLIFLTLFVLGRLAHTKKCVETRAKAGFSNICPDGPHASQCVAGSVASNAGRGLVRVTQFEASRIGRDSKGGQS
jgi:hypothetical protein